MTDAERMEGIISTLESHIGFLEAQNTVLEQRVGEVQRQSEYDRETLRQATINWGEQLTTLEGERDALAARLKAVEGMIHMNLDWRSGYRAIDGKTVEVTEAIITREQWDTLMVRLQAVEGALGGIFYEWVPSELWGADETILRQRLGPAEADAILAARAALARPSGQTPEAG